MRARAAAARELDKAHELGARIVTQLDDDDCDNDVDERDIPDIVFFTFEGSDYNNNGGSAAALRAGAEFAARYDAPVIVLRTVPPSGFGAGRDVVSGRVQSSISEATRSAVGLRIADSGIDADEVLIEPGFPDEVIDRIAEERQVGCIAMGTQGRRGIEYAVVGSITESVLRRAACPVLAVRA